MPFFRCFGSLLWKPKPHLTVRRALPMIHRQGFLSLLRIVGLGMRSRPRGRCIPPKPHRSGVCRVSPFSLNYRLEYLTKRWVGPFSLRRAVFVLGMTPSFYPSQPWPWPFFLPNYAARTISELKRRRSRRFSGLFIARGCRMEYKTRMDKVGAPQHKCLLQPVGSVTQAHS